MSAYEYLIGRINRTEHGRIYNNFKIPQLLNISIRYPIPYIKCLPLIETLYLHEKNILQFEIILVCSVFVSKMKKIMFIFKIKQISLFAFCLHIQKSIVIIIVNNNSRNMWFYLFLRTYI